jgi:uridine kinase
LKPLIKDIEKILLECKYDYLLLDYPFSYCNDKIKKYINFSIYIDTPLDIAMARRILRGKSIDIRNEMKIYLEYGRTGYLNMLEDVKPTCDLTINGENQPEEIVEIIIDEIQLETGKLI